MNDKIGPYHVVDPTPGRRVWLNTLNLTVIFDHDVIDGAPAARFTRRLVEFIESGYGSGEEQPMTLGRSEPETTKTAKPVPA